MKNNKGQSLYYFLVWTLILVISWAMMLNIAKLIRDRMIMQNEADNIALSVANHKARAMNFVGACNYLIGAILSIGSRPELIQIPTLTTETVGAYPYGDIKDGVYAEEYDDVERMKNVVDGLQEAQEGAMLSHLLYQAALTAEYLEAGDYKLLIYPIKIPTKENAEEYFGLKRNSKGIKYIKTINSKPNPYPHIVYNPFPGGAITSFLSDTLLDLLKAIGLDAEETISSALGIEGKITDPKVYEKDDVSWYITDENFGQQKIQVMLYKQSKKDNAPLFSKLFGIKFPAMTAFSAASIYNTKGPMFPTEESELIGQPDDAVFALLTVAMIAQMAEFSVKMVSKDSTPYKVLSIASIAYVAANMAAYLASVKYDPATSPMNAYSEAKFGGWAGHLIPYKKSS